MYNLSLWEQCNTWKKECKFIELTHDLSPETPRWIGWSPLEENIQADLDKSLFKASIYTVVGQYGTHVDAPSHMIKGGRSLHELRIDEMFYPLCVVDKSAAVAKNADYSITVQDILDWEAKYGKVPVGACVAFRSDWSKREPSTLENLDSEQKRHFPGWALETIKFLVEERNIGAIGHETSDTEVPAQVEKHGFMAEHYILAQDRIQIELLRNLDLCPPVGAIIFCAFPKLKDGTGFSARCFAVCPK